MLRIRGRRSCIYASLKDGSREIKIHYILVVIVVIATLPYMNSFLTSLIGIDVLKCFRSGLRWFRGSSLHTYTDEKQFYCAHTLWATPIFTAQISYDDSKCSLLHASCAQFCFPTLGETGHKMDLRISKIRNKKAAPKHESYQNPYYHALL